MLDFVIGNEGIIWVLLDGTEKMVRLVKWDSVAEEVRVHPNLTQSVDYAFP